MVNQVHLIDAPTSPGPVGDILAGPRRVAWLFELVDTRNRFVRAVDGMFDCELEWNLARAIRGGGTVSYQGEPIDWTVHRLRIHYQVTAPDGRSLRWTLGTFHVMSPEQEHTPLTRETVRLDLYDATWRLEVQRTTAAAWTAPKGSSYVEMARYLLDRQSIQHSLEDSDKVSRAARSWPAGTTYRDAVNDLMDSAGNFSVWADPQGIIRSSRYVRPEDRGIRYRFMDTRDGLPYGNSFSHRRDTFDVPNEVILVNVPPTSEDPDVEPPLPLVGTARDTTSQFSWARRGVIISHLLEQQEYPDQASIDAAAVRKLRDMQQIKSALDTQHMVVPLAVNDVVAFTNAEAGLDLRAVVEKHTASQRTGLSNTRIREVLHA